MTEFDRFAENYKGILDKSLAISGDTSDYFADYKARYVAKVVGPKACGKILDFGCGVGLLPGLLQRYLPAFTLHGFDASAMSIEKISAGLRSKGVFTSNYAELDHDYDVIVVSNVLHHIHPDGRQGMICGLRNRLSASGMLVVFEHNPVNPLTQWVVCHCPLDVGAKLLSRHETVTYLKGAGLRLVRSAYIVFFPRPLGWFRRFEHYLAWCPFGAQYAMVADKIETGAFHA